MRTDPMQKGTVKNYALPDQSLAAVLMKNGGVPLSVKQVNEKNRDRFRKKNRVGLNKSYDAMT